jgi:hypothetical protein
MREPFPPGTEVIEVSVAGLRHIFNAIDPAPFHEKDLDPKAEEFIVGQARHLHRTARLGLLVHLDGPGDPADLETLKRAVTDFFDRRAQGSRLRLSELFRMGRVSALIGLAFLAASLLASRVVEQAMADRPVGGLFKESLLIAGWVAMWRPLEIFLYDWWPIRAQVRMFRRLRDMPVRIAYRQ